MRSFAHRLIGIPRQEAANTPGSSTDIADLKTENNNPLEQDRANAEQLGGDEILPATLIQRPEAVISLLNDVQWGTPQNCFKALVKTCRPGFEELSRFNFLHGHVSDS